MKKVAWKVARYKYMPYICKVIKQQQFTLKIKTMNLETFYATAQNLGTVEITDEFLNTWLDAANEQREMQIGDEVYFSEFEYIGSNAKSWTKIQGTILAITEKAIQVLDYRPEGNFKVWVPKSAIYNLEWCEDMPGWDGDLRRWFMKKIKIHQYQEKMA